MAAACLCLYVCMCRYLMRTFFPFSIKRRMMKNERNEKVGTSYEILMRLKWTGKHVFRLINLRFILELIYLFDCIHVLFYLFLHNEQPRGNIDDDVSRMHTQTINVLDLSKRLNFLLCLPFSLYVCHVREYLFVCVCMSVLLSYISSCKLSKWKIA